jgi:transglutaminase-like putative cysteine protease
MSSCIREQFLKDAEYRRRVEKQYGKQKELCRSRWQDVFRIVDSSMSLKESQAMKFILAYSSINDIADYDGKFFYQNVRASFAARDTFSWGKEITDELFRHFVLPVRVNNENLDSSRIVFFRELKDRIKGMSMKEAVLEVNHWCHEKVTYRGSDERTSSPLATVKTAFGRCGEESTFTVAALRSVCIPARQCYTPRWAHCDDNHAWVEVWVDGRWHYIGACEPEADLDVAWFTCPAKRAMLVSTNVFGDYEGPEDVLLKDERYTRINVLQNYTKVKKIFVRVLDGSGKPADSAAVEFQLYNYAEFYPLLRTVTDSSGICSFTTGYGDLLVWAYHDGFFGFSRLRVSETDTLNLVADRQPGAKIRLAESFTPPPEQPCSPGTSDSLKAVNSKRLAFEDKLRGAYESTFIDSLKAVRLAANLGLNPDTLWRILHASRGNYRSIIEFAASSSADKKQWILPVLSVISEKDLRDITTETLLDHLQFSQNPKACDREMFVKYILNPRIDNEWVRPWRNLFVSGFDESFKKKALADPAAIVEYVNSGVKPDKVSNYSRAPITPVGVYGLKLADPHSRDIFFVALCRSLGIPSRLEPGTRIAQYFKDGAWKDAGFEKQKEEGGERTALTIRNGGENSIKPEYYIHFTIERYSDGFYRSLDYETDPRLRSFPCTLELQTGDYLLVTGTRMKDGTVLAGLDFFGLEKGKPSEITIRLRKENVSEVLGNLDRIRLNRIDPAFEKAGNLVFALLEPDREPTKHFVADLKAKKDIFSSGGLQVVLLFRDQKDLQDFRDRNRNELPANIVYLPLKPEVLSLVAEGTGQQVGQSLPLVVYLNSKGQILYVSQGYRIGIGDELAKFIRGK